MPDELVSYVTVDQVCVVVVVVTLLPLLDEETQVSTTPDAGSVGLSA